MQRQQQTTTAEPLRLSRATTAEPLRLSRAAGSLLSALVVLGTVAAGTAAADSARPAVPAAAPGAPGPGDQADAADLIIRGAQILTMDPARPTASAVALRGPYVVYVGDDAGAAAWQGKRTRVIDNRGAAAAPAIDNRGAAAAPAIDGQARTMTVLPGLIDAHAHLVGLGLSLRRLDLRGDKSPEQSAAKVRAAARERDAGAWILGRGWDQNRYANRALPQRALLDQAAPGRPVFLSRIDGHAAWVSSEALQRAGITRATRDPSGGRIVRDAQGAPTGVLVDNAMDLVERVIPGPRPAEIEQAILAAARQVTALGLTGVHEMGLEPEAIAVYRRLAESERLPLRVYGFRADPVPAALAAWPDSPQYKEYLAQLGRVVDPPQTGAFFSLRGIKLFADGALGSRGAALLSEYSDDPGNTGLAVSPPGHLLAMARWGALHGYQIATHAIGDRANRAVLDAYEQAGVSAARDLRFRVEHVQVLSQPELGGRRFAKLGVIASVQPTHATSDMPWAGQRLGPARLPFAYAYRKLLSSGARLCAGSDFPVEEPDPRLGLHAAITRQDLSLQPPGGFTPSERLTLGEALRAFTTDAAYAAFMENQVGQVMAGRLADLTVLEGALSLTDPPAADPAGAIIPRRKVLLTVVNGKVVHDGLAQR